MRRHSKMWRGSRDDLKVHRCDRCGGKFFFAETTAGKSQALNLQPSLTHGTVILVEKFPGCRVRDRVACTLTKEQLASGRIWWRYTDHHATCGQSPHSSTPTLSPTLQGAA